MQNRAPCAGEPTERDQPRLPRPADGCPRCGRSLILLWQTLSKRIERACGYFLKENAVSCLNTGVFCRLRRGTRAIPAALETFVNIAATQGFGGWPQRMGELQSGRRHADALEGNGIPARRQTLSRAVDKRPPRSLFGGSRYASGLASVPAPDVSAVFALKIQNLLAT